MLVVGLLGGPLGGPVALVPDVERIIGGGMPMLSCDGRLPRSGILRGGPERGGALVRPPGGGGVDADGGGVPFVERGKALGGGGVAIFGSGVSAPGFLLTHRFRSGS